MTRPRREHEEQCGPSSGDLAFAVGRPQARCTLEAREGRSSCDRPEARTITHPQRESRNTDMPGWTERGSRIALIEATPSASS